MKKLFKGLLVAGVGAVIGYIVAKKVNEKEEEVINEETNVIDKINNAIDKIDVSKALVFASVGVVLFDIYSRLYKQNQINIYTDYRCIGLAYNTNQITKNEAISEFKKLLSSETGYTVKKLIKDAISEIEGE